MNPMTLLLLTLAVVGITTLTAFTMLPEGRRKHAFAFCLAWVVPGWGHLFLGRWKKAILFFCLLGFLHIVGLWLTGFRTVGFEDNPFYFVGQFGSGITALLGALLGSVKAYPRADLPLGFYSPGLLYICITGLLNIVVMMNCLDPRVIFPEKDSEDAPTPVSEGGGE